jgi:hypothetical protein
MLPSKISRLKIQKLTLDFRRGRNAKLLMFRNDRSDTPHLTISWENPSKEIDVHLKTRGAGGREEHRRIAVIHENDFIKLFASFEPALLHSIGVSLPKIRRVRPGWLGRKGYAVFYMDSEEKSRVIDGIAPLRRHRGKWERVPDMKALTDWARSPDAAENIYHPSILHDIAADGCDNPIFAGRVRGRHKPKIMQLHLVTMADGRSFWVRLDKLSGSMLGISKTLTLSFLKLLLPGDAWRTIYQELHLEELGLELT